MEKLGRISGPMLSVYVPAKSMDTLVWLNSTSPDAGFRGVGVLRLEAVRHLGAVRRDRALRPGAGGDADLAEDVRRRPAWLVTAALLACGGVVLNRFVLTIQTLSLPTLPFDEFLTYSPSWQETATFLSVIAYGVIVYSFSFRYLNLFPEERELTIIAREQQEAEPVMAGRF